MPNTAYERISNNDVDEDLVDIPYQLPRAGPHPELVVRPPVYYGDGAFDPPSSEEDEDEERFLHKSGLNGTLNQGDSEPETGLRVGGGKVSSLRSTSHWKSLSISPLASDSPEVPRVLSGIPGALVSLHWRVRRNQSLSWTAVPCTKGA